MPKPPTERTYELQDYVWVKQGEKGEHLARRKRVRRVAAASALGASTGTSVDHDDSTEQKQLLKEEPYVYVIVSGWDDHTQAMVDCYEVQWSTSNMWDVVPVRNCRPMTDTNTATNAAGGEVHTTDGSTDDSTTNTSVPSLELRRSRRAVVTTTPNKLRSDAKEQQQQHKKQKTKCSEIVLDDVVISPRLFHTTKMSHRKKPASLNGRLSSQFSLADVLQKRKVVAHPRNDVSVPNQNATLVTPTQPLPLSDGHGVAAVATTNRTTLYVDDATTAVDGAATAAVATISDTPKAAKGPPLPPPRVRPSHCRAIRFARAPEKSHSNHNAKGYKKQKSSACSEIALGDVVMSPHLKAKREPRKPNGRLSQHFSLADALQRKVADKAAQERDGKVAAKDDDAPTKPAALLSPQHMSPLDNGQGQRVDATAAAAANRNAATSSATTTAKALHGFSTSISATMVTQSTPTAATKANEKVKDTTLLLNDRIHLGGGDSNTDVSETTAAAARHAHKSDKPVMAANGQSKSSGKRKRASSLDIDDLDDRKMIVDCPFCLTGSSTTSSTKGHVHREAGIGGESHFYKRYQHLYDSVQLTPLLHHRL